MSYQENEIQRRLTVDSPGRVGGLPRRGNPRPTGETSYERESAISHQYGAPLNERFERVVLENKKGSQLYFEVQCKST